MNCFGLSQVNVYFMLWLFICILVADYRIARKFGGDSPNLNLASMFVMVIWDSTASLIPADNSGYTVSHLSLF